MGGFAASQMLYVAARLRLADHLAGGPLTFSQLATEAGAREAPLRRVVRALSTFGVFEVSDDGTVANTALSECLRASAHDSARDEALLYGEEHYHAMSELLQAVKSGGTAFEHAYRKPHFTYLASNPEAARSYYDSAGASSARTARSLVEEYDFAGAETVVDVGGGTGQLMRAIVLENPGLTGVLVDTAGMARKAAARIHADGLDERCEVETGDIFAAVPKGRDVYLLGHVLHGLDDEHAVCVLQVCARAARPDSRVLVIERLIPSADANASDRQFAAISDTVALAVSGGRERTLDEVEALLAGAGMEVRQVVAIASGDTVVDARRAR